MDQVIKPLHVELLSNSIHSLMSITYCMLFVAVPRLKSKSMHHVGSRGGSFVPAKLTARLSCIATLFASSPTSSYMSNYHHVTPENRIDEQVLDVVHQNRLRHNDATMPHIILSPSWGKGSLIDVPKKSLPQRKYGNAKVLINSWVRYGTHDGPINRQQKTP